MAYETLLKRDMLKRSVNFGALPDRELDPLAAVAEARAYAAGEPLFLQGRRAEGLYILVTGAISVARTGSDGRQQILHVFEAPGDLCGEAAMFEGGTYPATAATTIDSRVLYLRRADFLALARRNPEILMMMLGVLSQRLRWFASLIDDLSLKDVGARLAKHLVELSRKNGDANTVTLATSKGALAARLGTISETVSRTLRKFQQQGLIAVEGRTITILKPAHLAGLAELGASAM